VKCPTDQSTLQIAERLGIEIDYCPECRGVWLDRGELDKIIERADGPGGATPPTRDDRSDRSREPRRDGYDDDRPRDGRKKRSSFLGELFELGG
jgi:Zn-finger nucleic acid-binding protein